MRNSEVLTRVRWTVVQLVSLPVPRVRQVATDILSEIDAALALPERAPAKALDASALTTEQLLAEVARRIKIAKPQAATCSKCGRGKVRASGLCRNCYMRDWREKNG